MADAPFSDRESEVLELLAIGQSNQALADTLQVSVRTVENHVYSIFRKPGGHQRAQAMQIALGRNYIPSSSA